MAILERIAWGASKCFRTRRSVFPRPGRSVGRAFALMSLLSLLAGSARGESPLNEYQVKSLFLLHFSKYVEWPTNAFETARTPIVIGLIGGSGEGKFARELAKAVEGKSLDGRPILILQLQASQALDQCHILFVRASEKSDLSEILGRLKTKPVLTVGETDQFMEQGGVINLVKKEGRIRLEINLDAARLANLQISSRLLSVADVVKGKLK
jgi:hypothetical protein